MTRSTSRTFLRCGVSALLALTCIPVAVWGQTNAPAVAITSAANYRLAVAPDSLASLFGANLAGEITHARLDATGNLPLELDGVSVEINGRKVGLVFVSPGQINLWIPPQTEPGEAQVVVKRSDATVLGAGKANVQRSAPALFSVDATGRGAGAIINAVTYKLGPFRVETSENPGADKQTRLSIYATGLRLAGDPGNPAPAGNVASYVKAQVIRGDKPFRDLAVEYAGPAPGYFGLDQVNVVLPKDLDGDGIATVTVSVGDRISNGVSIQVWSLLAPEIKSFSPASLPPGAPLTITGVRFGTGLPRDRNRIAFDAGNGLSAVVLPIEASATTLKTFVPALAKDPQGEWYKGPVTLCVETDGQRNCSPQPLLIQAPAAVSGKPGDLLIQFVERSNRAVIESIQALGSAQWVEDFRKMSAQALLDLRKKIADAEAGNPQRTTVTLEDGQTITVVFDLATIRKLEALLAAGEPSLGNIVRSMEQRAQSLKLRPASASTEEDRLRELKTLHQTLDDLGRALAISQLAFAGAALAGCVAFPPSCFALAAAVSTAAPYFAAATFLQVAGVATIELGPNSLQSLSTVPSNSVEVPLWSRQSLTVQGRFVSSMDPGLAAKEVAKRVISRWLAGALGLGFATSYIVEKTLSPVIGLIADALLDLGLRDRIRIETGLSFRDVPLTWNTVSSTCIHGSSPSTDLSFFVAMDWEIFGLQGMSSPERCDFTPYFQYYTNLLWFREGAPPITSLLVRVTPAGRPDCAAAFPDRLAPFQSVYYVSTPIANGDRLLVGNPTIAMQFWAIDFPGTAVSARIPLPRFTNERYCTRVQLAPGCTADAYVPTQEERNGRFTAFAGVLLDPLTGRPGPGGATIMDPFPGGIIPFSRQGPGGVHAWRVRSTQGCGQ